MPGVTGFISSLFAGGVGDVVEKVGDAIHKNVTSDKERLALENEAAKAAQDFNLALARMDTDLALGQDKIQEIEAASTNWFIAGARPAAMWVCVLGLAYQYLVMPMASWGSLNWGWQSPPSLDLSTLTPLLCGMLGLGGLRTFERVKGVIPNGK